MFKAVGSALIGAGMLASPVAAGEGADALRAALYGGTFAAGMETLAPMAAAGDQEARFGLGLLGVLSSAEHLTQALYRHGAAAPDTGPLGPVLGAPIPANPAPEPLDYETFRAILQDWVTTLDTARDAFVAAGESGDYVIEIDPMQVRMDVNGDGVTEACETLVMIIEGLNESGGDGPPVAEPVPDANSGGRAGSDRPAMPSDAEPVSEPAPEIIVGFDRADAIWFAGYTQVFALQADFILAHDFSDLFNAAFHRLFPRAGLLMQAYAKGGTLAMDPETDAAIADLIAAVHTLNWPVIDAARLKGVLARAQSITNYSRQNWEAILSETDDNHELVPSPKQTSLAGAEFTVTEAHVAAWHETLDVVDKVLNGELLLPHWRFKQGFDLRAYFETATRTDIVMLMTGVGAIPFLKDGPIADAESFGAATRAFGENLPGYAFWFN